MKEMTVPAEITQLNDLISFVEGELEANGCPFNVCTEITLAVEEIFVNIANYAYDGAGGEAVVAFAAETLPDGTKSAIVSFTDSGKRYNPLEKPDPDITLSLEEREIGGLGIYMVKQLVDSVDYEYKEHKNILTIKKRFTPL